MEHVEHVKLILMERVGLVLEWVQRRERWEHVKRRLLFVVQTARVMLVVVARKSEHEVNHEIKGIRFTESAYLLFIVYNASMSCKAVNIKFY